MNKISSVFYLLFALAFTSSSYAESPNNLRWDGDFFIKKETDYLTINREYSVHRTYTSAREEHLFSYKLPCSANNINQEEINFSGRNRTNIDVKDLSIKGNDSVRFSASLNDPKKIKELIYSTGFNVYSFGGDINGEMSLRNLIPFLEKHQDIILECQEELNQSIAEQKRESNQRIAEQKREQITLWVIYVVTGIIGLIFSIFIIRYLISKLKTAKSKTKELGIAVAKNVSDRKNKKFERKIEKKIIESAVDEIVRQTVKRAMSEGVDPSEISICPKCKGAGCNNCLQKGWVTET